MGEVDFVLSGSDMHRPWTIDVMFSGRSRFAGLRLLLRLPIAGSFIAGVGIIEPAVTIWLLPSEVVNDGIIECEPQDVVLFTAELKDGATGWPEPQVGSVFGEGVRLRRNSACNNGDCLNCSSC